MTPQDVLAWIEVFKATADTKVALILAVVLALLAGGWVVVFVRQFIRKDRFFEIINQLGETISANTEKALRASQTASDRCREETSLLKLSFEGHKEIVAENTKALADLGGQFKELIRNQSKRKGRGK